VKSFFVGAFLALCVLLSACSVSVPKPTTSEPLEAQANFWQPLGGLIDSSRGAAIAHFNGVPFIAYGTYANGSPNIYVKQWNAGSWVQLSTGLAAGNNPSSIFDYDMAEVDPPN
jgi:hypothetical protein